jgi:hypothetical protein
LWKYEVDIVIITDYTLNNFTTHITILEWIHDLKINNYSFCQSGNWPLVTVSHYPLAYYCKKWTHNLSLHAMFMWRKCIWSDPRNKLWFIRHYHESHSASLHYSNNNKMSVTWMGGWIEYKSSNVKNLTYNQRHT